MNEQGRREGMRLEAGEARARASTTRQRAAALRQQAEETDALADTFDADALRAEAEIAALAPIDQLQDGAAIRAELEAAERINAGIAGRSQRADYELAHRRLVEQIDGLTAAIDAREAEVEAAIRGAAMPVPGLGFGENFVSLGGLPFDQASAAEQLRVSVAIAMAANPELRVIRIMDGSLLDDDGVKWLASVAAEADYQVWIERVDSSGKVGITIDDGQVAAIEGVEQPPAIPKLL